MSASSFTAKRVRIKFAEKPWATQIFDADTGEMIPDVMRLDLSFDLNTNTCSVQLLSHSVPTLLEGEVVADVSQVINLSEVVLDHLAYQVERKIAERARMQALEAN